MRSSRVAIRSTTILALLLALTTACGTDDAPTALTPSCTEQGRARFVNLITDPARNPVDAILENVPWGVGLGYTATTPASLPAPSTAFYSAVCTGSRSVVLQRTANTTVTVATLSFTVDQGVDRTVYAIGGTGGGAVTAFATTDDNASPAAGQTRVRVVNMSPSAGAIDVFLTTSPTADLGAATPIATNIPYQGTSAYVNVAPTVAPATYTVRAVPTGTAPASRNTSVTITQTGIAAPAGTGRTIVTADNASGPSAPPFRAFALSDR